MAAHLHASAMTHCRHWEVQFLMEGCRKFTALLWSALFTSWGCTGNAEAAQPGMRCLPWRCRFSLW